jgi:hypothetical protein
VTDSGRRIAVLVNIHDGIADGRIDLSPFVVELGAGAGGIDDLVRGGHDVCGVLDDEFERMEDIAAALGVEPGGVDVTLAKLRRGQAVRGRHCAEIVALVLLSGSSRCSPGRFLGGREKCPD